MKIMKISLDAAGTLTLDEIMILAKSSGFDVRSEMQIGIDPKAKVWVISQEDV